MMMWSIIRFQKIGFHNYPGAPDEVSYLRNLHRHIFFIEVWVEQQNDNRDVEYHILKNQCRKEWDTLLPPNMEYLSCEMMATRLRKRILLLYPKRKVKISVFEDNECGTIIE